MCNRPFRTATRRLTALVLLAALAGCGGGTADGPAGSASPTPGPPAGEGEATADETGPTSEEAGPTAGAVGPGAGHALPAAHVHGVGVNPADDRVYLATHEGLYRYDDAGPTRVGPLIDLMGFTVAGPDHFYASGHPGPGVDLAEPVGLIESTDAGQTWTALSREGVSDFHTLAAWDGGVVAFDGATASRTTDGRTWQDLSPPVPPYSLAVSPDGQVLLATSQSGPVRSVDAGATWSAIDGAPLLMLVDWADDRTVVGVTPDGRLALSEDAGARWSERGSIDGPPQALGAHRLPGSVGVVVATEHAVVESVDGGRTLRPLASAR